MIWLRGFQTLCAVAITVFTALGLRPVEVPPVEFSLGVLGEAEQEDGSWAGADLLRAPEVGVDRAQLWVRVRQRARVRIDAVEAMGDRPLVSQSQGYVTLAPGKLYVFPSPHEFFRITGEARLKVSIGAPESDWTLPTTAALGGKEATVEAALTDGAPFPLTERAYRGRGVVLSQLHVRGVGPRQ
jgi:hypothetical protein